MDSYVVQYLLQIQPAFSIFNISWSDHCLVIQATTNLACNLTWLHQRHLVIGIVGRWVGNQSSKIPSHPFFISFFCFIISWKNSASCSSNAVWIQSSLTSTSSDELVASDAERALDWLKSWEPQFDEVMEERSLSSSSTIVWEEWRGVWLQGQRMW